MARKAMENRYGSESNTFRLCTTVVEHCRPMPKRTLSVVNAMLLRAHIASSKMRGLSKCCDMMQPKASTPPASTTRNTPPDMLSPPCSSSAPTRASAGRTSLTVSTSLSQAMLARICTAKWAMRG